MAKESPFLSDAGIHRKWIDNEDGTFTISATQNLEGLIDRNKAMYNHNDGYTPSRDMQRVASIPQSVIDEFSAKGINLFNPAFEPELRKLLNDPDFRGFRTAHGYIGPKHRHV